jgi:hypothetical protein
MVLLLACSIFISLKFFAFLKSEDYRRKAKHYNQINKEQKVFMYLQKGVMADPQNPNIVYWVAKMFIQKSWFKDAKRELDKLNIMSPYYPDVLKLNFQYYYKLNDWASAENYNLRYFQKFRQRNSRAMFFHLDLLAKQGKCSEYNLKRKLYNQELSQHFPLLQNEKVKYPTWKGNHKNYVFELDKYMYSKILELKSCRSNSTNFESHE